MGRVDGLKILHFDKFAKTTSKLFFYVVIVISKFWKTNVHKYIASFVGKKNQIHEFSNIECVS